MQDPAINNGDQSDRRMMNVVRCGDEGKGVDVSGVRSEDEVLGVIL
jgi:hypothetical protein